jgi:hypothetical protein
MFDETTQEKWSSHIPQLQFILWLKNITSMERDLSMCQMFGIIIFNYGIEKIYIH